MKAFTTLEGLVVPLDRANVDTDQIIPKQYLKAIGRTGFGDYLFDGWRYLDEGTSGKTQNERRLNRAFVLNEPRYQGASILVARENFGCGSSREHAVWAIEEYGVRCVIAPSFADIFYNNCFKNGVLPIVLEEKIVAELLSAAALGSGFSLRVDLAEQRVALPDGRHFRFQVDGFRKHCLLNGLDDIGLTLQNEAAIRSFELDYLGRHPWLQTQAPVTNS